MDSLLLPIIVERGVVKDLKHHGVEIFHNCNVFGGCSGGPAGYVDASGKRYLSGVQAYHFCDRESNYRCHYDEYEDRLANVAISASEINCYLEVDMHKIDFWSCSRQPTNNWGYEPSSKIPECAGHNHCDFFSFCNEHKVCDSCNFCNTNSSIDSSCNSCFTSPYPERRKPSIHDQETWSPSLLKLLFFLGTTVVDRRCLVAQKKKTNNIYPLVWLVLKFCLHINKLSTIILLVPLSLSLSLSN